MRYVRVNYIQEICHCGHYANSSIDAYHVAIETPSMLI